jgi:hypothetical protein
MGGQREGGIRTHQPAPSSTDIFLLQLPRVVRVLYLVENISHVDFHPLEIPAVNNRSIWGLAAEVVLCVGAGVQNSKSAAGRPIYIVNVHIVALIFEGNVKKRSVRACMPADSHRYSTYSSEFLASEIIQFAVLKGSDRQIAHMLFAR